MIGVSAVLVVRLIGVTMLSGLEQEDTAGGGGEMQPRIVT